MDNDSLRKIEELFKRHIGVLSEDFQHKLDLVVEGQQMLAEKLELTKTELKDEIRKVDQRLTMVEARLEQKMDAVAADLSAHRADTEAHHEVYRVKEG
ncbi:hypothetical protein [Geobacter sp.]|uniref:hypothetical protein n=1 Tax=Geobacter sp. TaxID=46610 RepID=UPI0034560325